MNALQRAFENYTNVARLGSLDLFFALVKEGIASFLILYLVLSVGFSDPQAYVFIGLKDVVSYVIPFGAAMASSHYIKTSHALVMGMFFMAVGCAFLSFGTFMTLNLGFGFFLFGYGLGRPTLPVLLVNKQGLSLQEKETRVRFLYLFGSLASIASPLMVGGIAALHSYEMSFAVLSGFCMLGTLLSLYQLKKEKILDPFLSSTDMKKFIVIGILPFIFSAPFFLPVLKEFLLAGAGIWAVWFVYDSWKHFEKKQKKLMRSFFLILFSMAVYFTFQSQISLFIMLYIERFVDRAFFGMTFQTPWFSSIPPFFLLFIAPFLADILSRYQLDFKIKLAFYSLLFSFTGILVSSYISTFAILLVVMAYLPLYLGDFLLVPSAEAIINQFENQEIKRKLMGMLYLSMAFARLGGTLLCAHLMKNADTANVIPYQKAFLTLDAYVLGA